MIAYITSRAVTTGGVEGCDTPMLAHRAIVTVYDILVGQTFGQRFWINYVHSVKACLKVTVHRFHFRSLR